MGRTKHILVFRKMARGRCRLKDGTDCHKELAANQVGSGLLANVRVRSFHGAAFSARQVNGSHRLLVAKPGDALRVNCALP